jgi:UDP-4-amino-4,6-dideoxy-N-acetyl-beta-L-altrosamine transaminase
VIPYAHQSIDDDDIAAVVKALKGDRLTQGPHVDELEEALAERVGARFAVAFANGTAALHAAAAAAELGPGDVVVTSPLSFAASANCVRYVGATPGFVDIDPGTLNLDPDRVPRDCAGLVAVHYAGLPVDLTALPHRPRVLIEDAAHALGAVTPDGPVGNCARSDMCAFSFHPVKVITTGEGGAVTTNSPDLADRLRAFRHHGIVRKPERGGWYYEIDRVGYNYRLTDIQAALGTSQLAKLDRLVARRQALAAVYRERLAGLPLELPPEPPTGWTHAYHLFPIRVRDRRHVYDGLHHAGIGVQVHYVPIYRHPIYRQDGAARADFPHTEHAYESLLSLPLYPDLTEVEQDLVVERVSALVAYPGAT